MIDAFDILFRTALTLVFTTFVWTCSYGVARRLVDSERTSLRWGAAFVCAGWFLVAAFHLLGSFSAFKPSYVAPVSTACVLILWRQGWLKGLLQSLHSDVKALLHTFANQARIDRLLAFSVAVFILLRVLDGLGSPPRDWDSLTYHLLKAGEWVQTGTSQSSEGPGAWGYYSYFSSAGDTFFAWAMLWMHRDTFVAIPALLFWCGIALGGFTLARELGATPRAAFATTLCICALPSVLAFAAAAYVDNGLLAYLLLGATFLCRALRRISLADAWLAVSSLALVGAIKTTGLILLASGLVVLALAHLGRRVPNGLVPTLAVLFIPLGVAVPDLARAYAEKGSPLYPFSVRIGSTTLLAGNHQLETIISEPPMGSEGVALLAFGKLFGADPWMARDYVNFGPGILLFILLSVAALQRLMRDRPALLAWIAIAFGSLIIVFATLSPGSSSLITVWGDSSGRLLLVPLAIAVLPSSLLTTTKLELLRTGVAASGLLLSLPRLLGTVLWPGAAWSLVCIVPFAAAVAVLHSQKFLRGRLVYACVAAAMLSGACIGLAREHFRYALYHVVEIAAESRLHHINKRRASGWRIWAELNSAAPKRIAVVAGWHQKGHNWILYPLLGSKLQNSLVYASPLPSGELPDYSQEDSIRAFSAAEWLGRLRDSKAEYLALMTPMPPEAAWVEALPQLFSRVAQSDAGALYKVRLAQSDPPTLSADVPHEGQTSSP